MNEDDVIGALNERDQFAMAEVELGISLEQFLESAHGKYLKGRAEILLRSARDRFEAVCPSDTDAIIACQNDARVARLFMEWVTEGIANGDAAAMRLKLEDTFDDY